jgi:hypothetical protein
MPSKLSSLACVLLLLAGQVASGQGQEQQTQLTNQDVVKMVKAGLAESTITLLIRQSATNFDTSPQALISLTGQGVSQNILNAMITAGGARTAPASPAARPTPEEPVPDIPGKPGIYYKDGQGGWIELQQAALELKFKGAGKLMLTSGLAGGQLAEVFKGAQAAVQVAEHRPTFYVYAGQSAFNNAATIQTMEAMGYTSDHFFFLGAARDVRLIQLLKLKKEKKQREIESVSRSGLTGASKAGYKADNIIEASVTRLSNSLLAVAPNADLEPGEYVLSFSYGPGLKYDFGIAVAGGAAEKGVTITPPSAAMPGADQIITAYVQAVGDAQARANVSTVVTKGLYTASFGNQPLSGTFESYQKTPNRFLNVFRLDKYGVAEDGYDGAVTWSKGPNNRLVMGDDWERAYRRREAALTFLPTVTGIKSAYQQITLKGTTQLDGQESYVVEMTPADGLPEVAYFDTKTGLLTRLDVVFIKDKKQLPTQIYASDYREVQGLKFPFTVKFVRQGSNSITRVSEVLINQPVEDNKFIVPAR